MRAAYDSETIEAVWQKAREIPGLPATIWRRDPFGATIRRFDYDRTDSDFGWVVLRGAAPEFEPDTLSLQPCQWRNATVQRGVPATGVNSSAPPA